MCAQRTQISLGGCPGCASLLVTQVILLVLSWGGSNTKIRLSLHIETEVSFLDTSNNNSNCLNFVTEHDLRWACAWQKQTNNDLCAQRWLRSVWASTLIRPVWSGFAVRLMGSYYPRFLHADSQDSDQTGRMPRLMLISVFAGRTGHFTGRFVLQLRYQHDMSV